MDQRSYRFDAPGYFGVVGATQRTEREQAAFEAIGERPQFDAAEHGDEPGNQAGERVRSLHLCKGCGQPVSQFLRSSALCIRCSDEPLSIERPQYVERPRVHSVSMDFDTPTPGTAPRHIPARPTPPPCVEVRNGGDATTTGELWRAFVSWAFGWKR